jgi:hypothetical protein
MKKTFLRGGSKGVWLTVGFFLSSGGVLESLLYPLGTCIKTIETIINVEDSLV